MRNHIIIFLGILFIAGCANPRVQPEAPTRHNEADAARYVRWWAKNIDSRSDNELYERALVGNSAALKEILDDPHNNHGPADQEGDASYVLAGAFIVVLGDTTFSEFVKSQNSDVQRSMFGGLLTGPWQHTETELAHRYPKTNSLRWRLFEAKPHQQEDEQAVRSDGHKPSSSVSTARSTAPAYAH